MDKLTAPVTVKFSPEGVTELHALAGANGMELSEYIRHLVSLDKEAARGKWRALNPLFANDAPDATNTTHDKVGRKL